MQDAFSIVQRSGKQPNAHTATSSGAHCAALTTISFFFAIHISRVFPCNMSRHHPDLVMCRKQAGRTVGRLCERCEDKCVICDSLGSGRTAVRICDECNYGSYQVCRVLVDCGFVCLIRCLLNDRDRMCVCRDALRANVSSVEIQELAMLTIAHSVPSSKRIEMAVQRSLMWVLRRSIWCTKERSTRDN